MNITLLGTGGPRPDPDRHGPAAMVQIGDQYLLFDAGRGVVLQADVARDYDGLVVLGHDLLTVQV